MSYQVPNIAIDPLGVLHPFSRYGFFDGHFLLLVFFHVVDQFAIGVVTGIKMGAVAKAFIGFLVDDGSEVLFGAERMSFGLLALVPSAVIAVLQVLLALEVENLDFFFVAAEVL